MQCVLLLFALFALFAPAVRGQRPNYMIPNYALMNNRYHRAETRYPMQSAAFGPQIPYNPYTVPQAYGHHHVHGSENTNTNSNTNVNTNPGNFE